MGSSSLVLAYPGVRIVKRIHRSKSLTFRCLRKKMKVTSIPSNQQETLNQLFDRYIDQTVIYTRPILWHWKFFCCLFDRRSRFTLFFVNFTHLISLFWSCQFGKHETINNVISTDYYCSLGRQECKMFCKKGDVADLFISVANVRGISGFNMDAAINRRTLRNLFRTCSETGAVIGLYKAIGNTRGPSTLQKNDWMRWIRLKHSCHQIKN